MGNLTPLHGGFWRYELYVSAWVAQLCWERYRYTGDLAYLREICYPIQREMLTWYTSQLALGDDGCYHIRMAKPVESQRPPDGSPFVADTLLDLAAMRQSLVAAIEAATLLGTDAELRAHWQHLLDHLAPLPVNTARRMFVAFGGADPELPNDHPTLLGGLYPSGLSLSPAEIEFAGNAFQHMLNATKREMPGFPFTKIVAWGDDLSYSWLTIAAARLGKRDTVLAYLYDLLILLQLKKNGFFASRPSDVPSRDHKVSLINTNGGFVQALTEMFLQSYDGLLRVFPATPDAYTSAFAGLQAVGNVTVDAAQTAGRLDYLRLTAGSAGVIRLRNDWGHLKLQHPDGAVTKTDEAIIILPCQAGEQVLLTPATGGQPFPRTWETVDNSTPRTWSGPRYLERLPAEQEWTVSIGQ